MHLGSLFYSFKKQQACCNNIQNKMETIKIQIDYTPAIDEIINLLKECGTEARKSSWNTIDIVITDDMNANDLVRYLLNYTHNGNNNN